MMDNKNFSMLPERVSLEVAASYFGLSAFSQVTKIDALMQYQRVNGLIFKTSIRIEGLVQLVSAGLEADQRPDGSEALLSGGESISIDTDLTPVVLGPLACRENGLITAMSFSYKGEDYYPLDDHGMHPILLRFNERDIYIDKSDLETCLARGKLSFPDYLNVDSLYYAHQLALAVQLHQELVVEGGRRAEHTMMDEVSRWLDNRFPDESHSGALVNRLATIIAPNKKK